MVSKDVLLEDLRGYLSFEEESTHKYSIFYQALGWRAVVKQEYHSNVENGLIKLKEDTEKHINLIRDMTKYVEDSNKDEF